MDTATAFCRALWKNDAKTIESLADMVAPNAKDRWGNTPLLMAAQYGELPLVALLVNRGADVDQGRQHLTPVTLAARRRASAIVTYLRNKGAAVSIFTRVYLGEREEVGRELARDPGRARLVDEAGTPLLLHAAEALQPGMLALLLDHGAGVGEADPNGETALHRVADLRQAPTAAAAAAKLLLDRGADPDARNWDDVTPLHQAVRARNLPVVEILLAGGADPNARDKIRGSTPLRRAVCGTGAGGTAGAGALMVPLTRILLEYGADPDARDKSGRPVRSSARAAEVRALLDDHRRKGGALGKGALARSAANPGKPEARKRMSP